MNALTRREDDQFILLCQANTRDAERMIHGWRRRKILSIEVLCKASDHALLEYNNAKRLMLQKQINTSLDVIK